MPTLTTFSTLTTLTAMTAVATLAVAAPADAASRLSLAGTGTSEVSVSSLSVAGEVSGTPVSGPYTGTVAVPGGIPTVGQCAPAYAELTVGEAGGATITLSSQGQLCTSIVPSVLQDFRGRFEVTGCSRRGWRGITGFLDVRAVDGVSGVYANS